MGDLRAEFIPVTDVKIGDVLVGGMVTGIRYSQSRKTIYFTMAGARGVREWPGQSTMTRTTVFTPDAGE